MPLPKPGEAETREEWNERCKSDETMLAEFPDEAIRDAICQSIWDSKDLKTETDEADETITLQCSDGALGEEDGTSDGTLDLGLPTDTKTIKHIICSTKIVSVDMDERSIIFDINTDDVDRDGEVVLPSGGKVANYRKNPVILYGHDYQGFPVAKSQWLKLVKENGRERWRAKAIFAPTDRANEVFILAAGGFLQTASIGFMPADYMGRAPTEEEIKRRPDWKKANRIYDKWEMLEWSVVPVPSNPHALARSVIAKKVKLPDGLLSDKTEDTATDERTNHYDVRIYEKDAHEATFSDGHDYTECEFIREHMQHGDGKHFVVIHGTTESGEAIVYRHYYPTELWTEEEASIHAAANGAIAFKLDAKRVRVLQAIPKEEIPGIKMRVVAAKPTKYKKAKVLATISGLTETEVKRSRGCIIR